MKKFILTLITIGLITSILPSSIAVADSEKITHEDPKKVTDFLDGTSLLVNYSRIILLASIRDYDSAISFLDEFGEIEIPEEFRYVINRYNELCRQLFFILDDLDTLLAETADMIARNEIEAARKNLDIAEAEIDRARILLKDLTSAMNDLAERLGVFLSPEASDLAETFARLEASMELLQQLLDSFADLAINLEGNYIERKALLPTKVTLNINPDSVYIGENVNVSGIFSSGNLPLADKKIRVIMDNRAVAEYTTDIDGNYSGITTIPYDYVESKTVYTVFEPTGDDIDIFQASRSSEVEICTLFYLTNLDMSAPDAVFPGIPFDLGGKINSDGENTQRTVSVKVNEIKVAEVTTTGQFNIELTLPDNIPSGLQELSATVHSIRKYSGTSKNAEITVSLMPIQVNLDTPGLIILPQSVECSGQVRYECGPLADANVHLTVNNESTTVLTTRDGSFKAKLNMPLDMSFIGQRDLFVYVDPAEPWADSLLLERQVMIFNPTGTVMALVATIAIIIYMSRRKWRTSGKDTREGVIIRPPVKPVPVALTIEYTGIKGRIVTAYRTILSITERISGMRLLPHMTLREFLNGVSRLLPVIIRPLTELTLMVEKVLYSNQSSTDQSAATAEQLTTDITEELSRGTS